MWYPGWNGGQRVHRVHRRVDALTARVVEHPLAEVGEGADQPWVVRPVQAVEHAELDLRDHPQRFLDRRHEVPVIARVIRGLAHLLPQPADSALDVAADLQTDGLVGGDQFGRRVIESDFIELVPDLVGPAVTQHAGHGRQGRRPLGGRAGGGPCRGDACRRQAGQGRCADGGAEQLSAVERPVERPVGRWVEWSVGSVRHGRLPRFWSCCARVGRTCRRPRAATLGRRASRARGPVVLSVSRPSGSSRRSPYGSSGRSSERADTGRRGEGDLPDGPLRLDLDVRVNS